MQTSPSPSTPTARNPVFTLRPPQTHLQIATSDSITAVSATGGLLWVGTSTGRILRHDTLSNKTDEVRGRLGVGRLDNAVWRIHADPYTYSALIILRNADGYHALGTGLVRPRWLAKLRGLRCVSCSWIRIRLPARSARAPPKSASVALLGTAFGALFSLVIDDKYEKDDVLAKLWSAPNGETIDGIRVEQVAGKYVGTVATTSTLYLFSDAVSLEELFTEEHVTVVSRTTEHNVQSASSSTLKDTLLPSELQFMTGNSGLASRRFVWASNAGVTHAQLAVRRRRSEKSDTSPSKASRSTVVASVVDKETISWDRLKQTSGSAVPLACNLSAFHVLVLYPGSVYAFNYISGQLTQRIPVWNPIDHSRSPERNRGDWSPSSPKRRFSVSKSDSPTTPRSSRDAIMRTSLGWEDNVTSRPFLSSPAAGFARDVLTDTLWVYTEDGDFACLVASSEEQIEAWKAAKAMGRFDLAMALAPLVSSHIADDSTIVQTREAVLEAQADYAAAEGNWDVAAQLYAKTNRPIEAVILDIVDACSTSSKAKSSSPSLDLSSLTTLAVGPRLQTNKHIITYLVRKLDRMDNSKPTQRTVIATILVQLYASQVSSEVDEKLRDEVKKDFGHFLADRHQDLDITTAINILTRNGCHEEAWNLALLSGDVLTASELSSRQEKIDQTISLLQKESVIADQDTYSRLVSSLSGALLALVPQKVAAAISSSTRKNAKYADHLILAQGLARVAREVKNEGMSRDAYESAVTYLREILVDWDVKDSEEVDGSSAASSSNEWSTLVTFLFQLHSEFGTESEAQYSYEQLVVPRVTTKTTAEIQNIVGPILRSARSAGFFRLCVYLYQALDLHEAAISLAVEIDPKLAESKVALLGESNVPENVKHSLWRLVASKSDDPVGVVDRSKGLLHIEDVLTNMAQFESVTERIKSAVADSLEEHKRLANCAKNDAIVALEVTGALREDLEKSQQWRESRQRESRHTSRMFPCGHRAGMSAIHGESNRECGLCGMKAIYSLDAPFDVGHMLPLKAAVVGTVEASAGNKTN